MDAQDIRKEWEKKTGCDSAILGTGSAHTLYLDYLENLVLKLYDNNSDYCYYRKLVDK